MIVVIEDEVFASSENASLLVGLFRLGFDGRHRIQVEPLQDSEADSAFSRWERQQHPSIREEIELALEMGLEGAVHGIPSDFTLVIGTVAAPDWHADPPVVPLEEADRLLRKPLQILLENRRNDLAFLKAIALEPWRRYIRQALDEGAIAPVHGGGLSGIKHHVEDLGRTAGDQLRIFALFDSDALEPGCPAEASEDLRRTCEEIGCRHHQLRRRASENYLPPKALAAWAHSLPRSRQRQSREMAEAFASLEPEQRHHYNMKAGFRGDSGREIPELFDGPRTNPNLQHGFGSNIAAQLYRDLKEILQDEWFVRDGQKEETSKIIQDIFRAL